MYITVDPPHAIGMKADTTSQDELPDAAIETVCCTLWTLGTCEILVSAESSGYGPVLFSSE
jgi:hypothetical protein